MFIYQFRSISPCNTISYIEMSFGTLYIDRMILQSTPHSDGWDMGQASHSSLSDAPYFHLKHEGYGK